MLSQEQQIEQVKEMVYQAVSMYSVSVKNNEPFRFRKHIPLLLKELELELIAAQVVIKK